MPTTGETVSGHIALDDAGAGGSPAQNPCEADPAGADLNDGRGGHEADHSEASDSRHRIGKSVAAFRTISEVSAELDVPQHVLRFWETKFTQLRPLKRGGGRRYYRPEDVALLRRIHGLLYGEGYTIKGVQRVLRTQRRTEAADHGAETLPGIVQPSPQQQAGGKQPHEALLRDILQELKILRALLD